MRRAPIAGRWSQEERDEILAYYHELREKSNLTHEDAMRASIVSLLVSPDFLYRADLVDTSLRRRRVQRKSAGLTRRATVRSPATRSPTS